MICKIRDAEIYYEVVGEGTPVVMLHGCAPDHRLLWTCMESVFQTCPGYQRIYIDLPGMGKSSAPRGINSSDQVLELLAACVRRIVPSRDFLLVGESYGGYLARGLLAQLPDRISGLLLLCPVVVAERDIRLLPDVQTLVRDEDFLNSLSPADRDEFCASAVVATAPTYARFRDEIKPGLDVADYEFIDRLQRRYAFSAELSGLKYEKPVLLLAGRQDAVVGYRDIMNIVESYPRATLAVLDMAGHNLQIEQPGLFESLVAEWLWRTNLPSP